MGAYQYESVEVLLLWQERVLSAHTFKDHIILGGNLSVPGWRGRQPLLRAGAYPGLFVREGMQARAQGRSGSKALPTGEHVLSPDETVSLALPGNLLQLQVRRIARAQVPKSAALLNLSASETAGVLAALAVCLLLAVVSALRAPALLASDGGREERTIPKVKVFFQEPVPAEAAPKPSSPPAPAMASPKPSSPPLASRPSRTSSPAAAAAPAVRAVKPTPSPATLLQAFASRGLQKDLERLQTSSAAVQLAAENATGKAGTGPGGQGVALRPSGSGAGSATVGSGADQGQGRGTPGYTRAGMIGNRQAVRVQVGGGAGESYSGSMDREAIRRVIREHLREVRFCYERRLQQNPDLFGKVVLQWDIVDGGKVASAQVKSSDIGDPQVAECLVTQLKSWTFPVPPQDQIGRVAFPFVFTAK